MKEEVEVRREIDERKEMKEERQIDRRDGSQEGDR